MNSETIILAAGAVSWVSALVTGTSSIIGSSIFDAKQSSVERQANKHPGTRIFKQRPFVSVVVVADNDEKTITDCLSSISQNGYRKHEIIIVDNDSKDGTRQKIKEYIKTGNFKNIKLLTATKSKKNLLTNVGLTKAKGEMVVFLDADKVLDKQALKRAANYVLAQQRSTWLVSARLASQYSVFDLARSTGYLLMELPILKLRTVVKDESVIKPGIMYDKKYLKNHAKDSTESIFFKLITNFIYWLLKTSWLSLVAYLAFVAIAHDYPMPLAIFLLSLFSYAVLIIISDSGSKLLSKIAAVLTLPASLSTLYVIRTLDFIKDIKHTIQLFRFRRFVLRIF